MRIVALIFFVVPLIEMIILIEVGGILGVAPTIALVVLTAVIGVRLLRLEGLATLNRVRYRLDRGEMPGTELLEGIMLLLGGALLLTPGFATDALGFVCLIPGLRRPLAGKIINSTLFRGVHLGGTFRDGRSQEHRQGTTIEGEFEVDPDKNR